MIPTGVHRYFAKSLFLLTLLACIGVPAPARTWNPIESGGRAKIRVKPQKNKILPGEPMFVQVEYTLGSGADSGATLYPYATPGTGTDGISITALRVDGTPVARPNAERFARLAAVETWGVSPDAKVAYWNLLLPRWADFREPGTYRITVSNNQAAVSPQTGQSTAAPILAETTITVLPADDAKLGELIRDLGKKAMPMQRTIELNLLYAVEDPRAIPFLVQKLHKLDRFLQIAEAMKSGPIAGQPPTATQDPKMAAKIDLVTGLMFTVSDPPGEIPKIVGSLAGFTDDAALKEISTAAKSRVPLVRKAVAHGLASNRDPKYRTIFTGLAQGPEETVRSAVAEGLAADSSPESLTILEKLLNDLSPTVRKAAQQSLDARKANNPQ